MRTGLSFGSGTVVFKKGIFAALTHSVSSVRVNTNTPGLPFCSVTSGGEKPFFDAVTCTTTAADELALLAIDAAGRVAPPPSLLQPTMASANKHAVQPLMAFIWEE